MKGPALLQEGEKKRGEGNGVTSLWHTVRLVLRSSFISSTLIPTSPFAFFHIPSPGLVATLFQKRHEVVAAKRGAKAYPKKRKTMRRRRRRKRGLMGVRSGGDSL